MESLATKKCTAVMLLTSDFKLGLKVKEIRNITQ